MGNIVAQPSAIGDEDPKVQQRYRELCRKYQRAVEYFGGIDQLKALLSSFSRSFLLFNSELTFLNWAMFWSGTSH